jgi:hypothetical protein
MPTRGAFDPFNDRLSRDLRNDLSAGLLAALAGNTPTPFLTVAAAYRQRPDLPPYARGYLAERLACYQVILAAAKPDNPDQMALQFWNHELFFEFHELLEQRWLLASGIEKEVLQGLIRAAGSYIHRRADNIAGADKMAARATETIKKYRDRLPPGFAAPPLLAGLSDPNGPPPRLGALVPTDLQCQHTSG